jgi:hypothetical protein
VGELLQGVLVLGCLVGILVFVFKGGKGRVGRPPSGILTRPKPPGQEGLGLAVLAALALSGLTNGALGGPAGGAVVGLLVALGTAVAGLRTLTGVAANVLGVAAAAVGAYTFTVSDTFDPLTVVYRISLMSLLFAFFCLGVLVFNRASAVAGARGLALFGLIEIVTYLADPGGADVFVLDDVSHLAFVGIVCVAAFALGWAASEFVIGVTAIAVSLAALAYGTAVPGGPEQGWAGVLAMAGAAVAFLVVARLTRPLRA